MRPTKTQAERAHAKRRLLERYGIQANRALMDRMSKDIREGRSEFVEKQSLRVSKHRVQFAGTMLTVIYDKRRRTVVTVLPDEPNI